jgi:transposase
MKLSNQILNKEQIKEIAIKYARGCGATELAKKFGVTKQRIQQVVMELRKNGVDIPHMKGELSLAIHELKKDNPELFKNK